MVIYLAPSDYHRFHSPGVVHADFRRHIVGYLDPVKPAYVNKHKDVFKNNERVNLFGSWNFGFFLTSFVGALNVGSIKLNFESNLRTNNYTCAEPYQYDNSYNKKFPKTQGSLEAYLENNFYDSNIKERPDTDPLQINDTGIDFLKGEETGMFEMGSTIVLVFEGPQDTQLHVKEGMRLWLGQEIVTTGSQASDSTSSSDE
jgi:phosphatidylserine decarboxylase